MINGPVAACSNNGCTSISDGCLEKCNEQVINEKVYFDGFFDMDNPEYTANDLIVAFDFTLKLLVEFRNRKIFDRVHYNLTSVVVRPLVNMPAIMPNGVEAALSNLNSLIFKKLNP
jgi:hypothetical protein